MARRLSSENVGEALVVAVPELRSAYDAELAWWGGDDPGDHNLFANVVNPYLWDALQQRESGDDLDRLFAFIERMAVEDESLAGVVQVTICERLGDDRQVLAHARRLMGPETLRHSVWIERFWCREPWLAPYVGLVRHRILRIPWPTRFERWLFWTPEMKAAAWDARRSAG
jgi:hypothetical protein